MSSEEVRPAPREGVPPVTAWTALAILSLFYILSSLDRGLFAILSPVIQKSIKLTDVQLSLLQGVAFSLFFGVAGMPLGWAADRYSRRWIIFLGVIFWSLSTAATGLASNFLGLFLPRAGVGAGEASLSPCAQSLLADLFPRKRLAFAAAVYGVSANVGAGIGTAFAGVILAALTAAGGLVLPLFGHLLPWQAVFVLVGVPGGLLAALAFLLHEPHRQPGTVVRADASTWGDFFAFIRREPRLLALHFMSFPMAAMAIYTSAAWMPMFLNRVQHMPIIQIGAALALSTGLTGLIGNLIAGFVSDRVGQSMPDAYYRISMITCLISVPFGIAMFLVPSGGLTVILYALFYATGGAFAGTATASLNVIMPESLRGKAFSCYWLWMAVMGAIGPLVAATLTEHVFRDPMAVGRSAAIVIGVTMPIAALSFRLNLKALRRVVLGQDTAHQPLK